MMLPNTQEVFLDQTPPRSFFLDGSPDLSPATDAAIDCPPTLLPNNSKALAELSRLKSGLTKHQTLVLVGMIAWCLSALQPVRRRDWEILGKELPERVIALCYQLDSESLLLVMASASRSLLASTWLADQSCFQGLNDGH